VHPTRRYQLVPQPGRSAGAFEVVRLCQAGSAKAQAWLIVHGYCRFERYALQCLRLSTCGAADASAPAAAEEASKLPAGGVELAAVVAARPLSLACCLSTAAQ
jgi:hypothetical protein